MKCFANFHSLSLNPGEWIESKALFGLKIALFEIFEQILNENIDKFYGGKHNYAELSKNLQV